MVAIGVAPVEAMPAGEADAMAADDADDDPSFVPMAVHNRRGNNWTPVHHSRAKAYALTITAEDAGPRAVSGCHFLRSTDGCAWGMSYLYSGIVCGTECVWSPLLCAFGVPLPCGLCYCSRERDGNVWVMRHQGRVVGALAVVNAETGVLASYGEKLQYPDCYCERMDGY